MSAKTRQLPIIFIAAFFLFACAAGKEAAQKEAGAEISAANYPKTVAVVPFGNDTEEIGISGQVRKSFFNHISSKPFQSIKPSVVDEKVATLEKAGVKTIFDIPPGDIGNATGAAGIIYGRVTDFKKIYAVAYSQMGVEAEVWMVDARTGKELWRFKEAVRYHEGGASLSPLGMVMTAVSTAMNLREIQQVRVVNELGWKLSEKIPVPEGLKFEERPAIKNVISNAKEGPFGKGRVVKVGMEGEKGFVGLFEIGGFKKALPMKEVSAGEYLGEYLAVPGDNVKEAPITVYLKRPTGEESQWQDITGFVTIDTTPPPPVSDLKGRTFPDRLELTWKDAQAPDLKGYKILRSKKPLSDYEEAGFTEEARFADKKAQPKEVYYYRVAPVDTAGNVGDTAESVKLSLRESEIKELPARIDADMTLFPGAYSVKNEVTVDAGVTLTAQPDTKIFFEKGAKLTVSGALKAEGEKDLWVEFLPRIPEERFKGIYLSGKESSLKYARIRGAENALSVKDAPVAVANSVIEYSGTGIVAEGIPSPKITDSTVWHNAEGIRLENSRASVAHSEITQNKTGLKLTGTTPELSENNIYANEINVETAGGAVNLDKNYLGSINTDEMRIKGGAAIAKALDAPYPGGKAVDVIVNPYASLTPDERKTKLAELLVAGGRYFKDRNFGRAASTFEETLKIEEGATTYYYLALAYQGMDDNEKALQYLKQGFEKFPMDSNLAKSYGLLLYQMNRETPAKEALREALRLNPGDRQIKFILERLEAK